MGDLEDLAYIDLGVITTLLIWGGRELSLGHVDGVHIGVAILSMQMDASKCIRSFEPPQPLDREVKLLRVKVHVVFCGDNEIGLLYDSALLCKAVQPP